MSTTASKLSYLKTTVDQFEDKSANLFGENFIKNATFRELANEYKNLWTDWPDKVTAEGTSITLNNVKNGKMQIQPMGNTELLLPNEYQQVEYIESTGTQYIDTGYIPVQGDNIKIHKFSSSEPNGAIISAGTEDYQYIILIIANQNRTYSRCFSSSSVMIEKGTSFVNSTLEMTSEFLRIDSTKVNNVPYAGNVNSNLNIFRRANASQYISASVGEIIITNNNVIKRRYIPCYKKTNNEIGLYETVTKTFYSNQGTGTFLKGEDYQTIKNVTGNNKVKIGRKNLAWNGWAEDFVNRINNNNKARIETFDNRNCLYYRADASYPQTDTNYLFKINWKENTQYTFSFELYADDNNQATGSLNLGIQYTDGTYITDKYSLIGGETLEKKQWYKLKITTSANKTIKFLTCNFASGFDYIDLNTFMVEEGSIQTEYEPYIEPIEKELNLTSKNVLAIENINTSIETYGYTCNIKFNAGEVVLNGNYSQSFSLTTPNKKSNYVSNMTDVPTFPLSMGTYTWSIQNSKNIPNNVFLLGYKTENGTKTYLGAIELTNPTIQTFIVDNKADVFFGIQCNSLVTFDNTSFDIMLEKNNTSTEYEPYYNYELCKIGDNSDLIFKNESNNPNYNNTLIENVWYKKNCIKKRRFQETDFNFQPVWNGDIVSYAFVSWSNANLKCANMLSAHFKKTTDRAEVGFLNTVGALYLQFNKDTLGLTTESTREEHRLAIINFFTNNDVQFMYDTTEITYTQITETTLINQLESLNRTIIEVPTIIIETESEEDNAQLIVAATALEKESNE